MHRSRRRERLEERREPAIGSYHELYFEDVADGVTYCQSIVPHVLPPVGTHIEGQPTQMAVWLHVPQAAEAGRGAKGCYLYLSHAVREALERVGQALSTTGTISRVALPERSVLVFGNDWHDSPPGAREIAKGRSARHGSRVAHFDRVLEDADSVLR
jgi:hypothetical protein